MTSPTVLAGAVGDRSQTIRILRSENQRLKDAAKAHVESQDEIEIPPGMLAECGIEHPVQLFEDKIKDLMHEKLESKGIVKHRDLIEYLWAETKLQAQRAYDSGKRTCWYSPVMIRWCFGLRNKLGKGSYEFLAETMSLPSGRTLGDYMSPGRGARDGII